MLSIIVIHNDQCTNITVVHEQTLRRNCNVRKRLKKKHRKFNPQHNITNGQRSARR